jgi:hypothetical protein
MTQPILGDWNRADQVGVEYIRQSPPFNTGETAGHREHEARQLIAAGFAVYVDPPDGMNEFGLQINLDPVPLPEPGELRAWHYGRDAVEVV